MIQVKLPSEAEKVLFEMARVTGRTVDDIAADAVLELLEDWEDARIAEERLKDDNGVYIPLEEVIRKVELREADDRRKKPAAE